MKILFVAMQNSIHITRWINLLEDTGWQIGLFPAYAHAPHSDLKRTRVFQLTYPFGESKFIDLVNAALNKIVPRSTWLSQVIRYWKPDIIHSMEIQHCGFLTLAARNHLNSFPPWIVSNWGSDIYLFGRLEKYRKQTQAVLQACDYYTAESNRDIKLGHEMGFRGKTLPVFQSSGGFDLSEVGRLRTQGLVSARKWILLKGQQGWAGRALFGLRALANCADLLRGYRVGIYSASEDVRIAAELLGQNKGLEITLLPRQSREEMLRLFGQARISLSFNISDGVSNVMLEAMAMGAFPIQSNTGAESEWLENGDTGILVDPESPEEIADAICKAVNDDALVDQAAEKNARVISERLDAGQVRQKMRIIYEQIYTQSASEGRTKALRE